jgi:hypothetical protein
MAYEAVERSGSHAMIRREDIRSFPGDADVVMLYLLPTSNDELWPILKERCKPFTRIISHDFQFTGQVPKVTRSVQCEDRIHKVYMYVL